MCRAWVLWLLRRVGGLLVLFVVRVGYGCWCERILLGTNVCIFHMASSRPLKPSLVGLRAHAARIDDMGTRIDDLEKALNDLMAQVC
jgi:hypothetical protein